MMIASGKGILTFAADAVHPVFFAIFYCYNPPVGVGVKDIGYQYILIFIFGKSPVLSIRFAIEVGLCSEDGHLFVLIPECALIIAIGKAGTNELIDIIAVWCTADIYVGLPDIATCCSMTMLHHILALIPDFMVAGEMGVTAKEFVSSLKLMQKCQELG